MNVSFLCWGTGIKFIRWISNYIYWINNGILICPHVILLGNGLYGILFVHKTDRLWALTVILCGKQRSNKGRRTYLKSTHAGGANMSLIRNRWSRIITKIVKVASRTKYNFLSPGQNLVMWFPIAHWMWCWLSGINILSITYCYLWRLIWNKQYAYPNPVGINVKWNYVFFNARNNSHEILNAIALVRWVSRQYFMINPLRREETCFPNALAVMVLTCSGFYLRVSLIEFTERVDKLY